MIQPLSPYALLCASKPTPTLRLPYDVYSQAQQPDAEPAIPAAPRFAQPQQSAVYTPPAIRKTHYVTDIQNRHGAASQRTRQMPWNP